MREEGYLMTEHRLKPATSQTHVPHHNTLQLCSTLMKSLVVDWTQKHQLPNYDCTTRICTNNLPSNDNPLSLKAMSITSSNTLGA